MEKRILPSLRWGLEPGTFRPRVRRSNHWAIPAPQVCVCVCVCVCVLGVGDLWHICAYIILCVCDAIFVFEKYAPSVHSRKGALRSKIHDHYYYYYWRVIYYLLLPAFHYRQDKEGSNNRLHVVLLLTDIFFCCSHVNTCTLLRPSVTKRVLKDKPNRADHAPLWKQKSFQTR